VAVESGKRSEEPEKPEEAGKPSWMSRAWPVLTGAGVTILVLTFVLGREPPPLSAAVSASSAAGSAAVSAAPAASPSLAVSPATSASLAVSPATSAPVAPPAAAPAAAPAPGERRARVIWDAMARRRAGNAVTGGTACTVEATVATTAEGGLAARDLLVQCGGKTVYEGSGVPAGAAVSVTEVPALEAGSFAYALRWRDERAEIDTAHGRAMVDVTAPVIGPAWLVVTNESRPLKGRLSAATADTREIPGEERLTGKVTNATGDTLVAIGNACVIGITPHGPADGAGRCDVLVQCGDVNVVGAPEPFSAKCVRKGSKVVSATDGEAEPADDDPGLVVEAGSARIWNGANGGRWLVTLALDAH
jgi:hypothetical protein